MGKILLMNHRERVLSALNHKEPDRVPIDLWGSASRLHTELYYKIVDYLGYESYGDEVRPHTTTAYVDYRISDEIDADFRHIAKGKLRNFQPHFDDYGNLIDEWGVGHKKVGDYWAVTYHPLAHATIQDIDTYKWPVAEDPGRIEGIEEQAKNWYKNTDYSITTTTAVSGLFMELGQYLRGTDKFFMDLYIDQNFSHKLIAELTDKLIEIYVYYLTPISKYIDWVEFTEDYGTQDRPFISKELFRKFFKKPHVRLFNAIKEIAPNTKIFFHSCGSIRELIPDFIDMGIDILNSLQPRAKGMDSYELKKEFGSELIFHGGIDIQEGICGSVEKAINEAKRRIDAFAPGGGYIFSPSNHFQPDTPIENFFAIYETAINYRKYRIHK